MQLSPDLEKVVRRIANAEGRSAESVIDDALRDYGRRLDARRDFIAEADAAWTAFEATGRHVTGTEIDAWLESWGQPGERPAPSCHD